MHTPYDHTSACPTHTKAFRACSRGRADPETKGDGAWRPDLRRDWARLPRVGLVAQHLGRHPRRRAYLRPLGRRRGCKRACCDDIPWEAVYSGRSGDTFTVRETLPAFAVLKSAILRQFAPKSQRMLWLFRSRCITCSRANHGVLPVRCISCPPCTGLARHARDSRCSRNHLR